MKQYNGYCKALNEIRISSLARVSIKLVFDFNQLHVSDKNCHSSGTDYT